MFPAQVTILPIYLGYAKTGLLNRPIGLALMYLTSSFGIFLVRQFMLSQPKALEEAALMDSAGYLKIFWRISLPQLRPALSALGIITFTQTWNYYFQAKVLLGPEESLTLPVAMDVLRGYLASGNLSVVMAAMSMSILPVVLLFLVAQKFVIEGITMSGIKNYREGLLRMWDDLVGIDHRFAYHDERTSPSRSAASAPAATPSPAAG